MRTRGVWLAACLLLMLGWVADAANEKPMVALVSSLSGGARINQKPAALLSPLSVGDVLELAPGASMVLSFTQGGVRANLAGPCRATVDAQGVKTESGQTAQVNRPTLHQGQSVAVDINVNKMGGFAQRDVDAQPEIAIIADAASLDGTPHIAWRLRDGLNPKEIKIRINALAGYDQKWTVPADADGFTVPQALKPGNDYMVYVTFSDDNGHHQANQPLKVLSTQDAARVKAAADTLGAEAAAHPDDTTPLLQRVNLYQDHELYSLALQDLTTVNERHPDDRNVTWLLGYLHKERHERDQAASYFARAMSLGFQATP